MQERFAAFCFAVDLMLDVRMKIVSINSLPSPFGTFLPSGHPQPGCRHAWYSASVSIVLKRFQPLHHYLTRATGSSGQTSHIGVHEASGERLWF
jgi:hypothetical protein